MSPETKLRTQQFLTHSQAHPYHGIDEEGRRALAQGKPAKVWKRYEPNCVHCQVESQRPAAPLPLIYEVG